MPATGLSILHICETARGGVGTYINLLAQGAGDHRVLLPTEDQSMLAADVARETFRRPVRSVTGLLRLCFHALRCGLRQRPDIVFCHSSFSLLALLLLRPLLPRSRFLYCAHGWGGARETRHAPLLRQIEGRLCGLAHRVVNVSQGEQAFARQHGYHGHHLVIENAVCPALPLPPATLPGPAGAVHLLFVGRLDPQKGFDLLLPAFAAARRQNPALHLHVIGEAVVQAACDTPDMHPEGVTRFGWIGADKIDSFYRAADLVLVPSRWEGMPLVVLEALRNGTPVMVSTRSNLPDLIEDGISGFATDLNLHSLTGALARCSKPALAAMRPAARARYDARFHSDRLQREMQALYAEVMQDAG